MAKGLLINEVKIGIKPADKAPRISKLKIKSTDDSRLVDLLGEKLKIINGSYENMKITTQDDIKVSEAILKSRLS